MENGEEANRGPEMARIRGDGAERVCGGAEEDAGRGSKSSGLTVAHTVIVATRR